MSFWNNPSASLQGFAHDPWHGLQNFATTGLVPMIPYVAGAIGGIFGGPAGAAAGGALGQEGVDYFGGNKDARTGKGITKSIFSGAGKGMLASGGYNYAAGGGLDGLGSLFGSSGGGETAINPATNLPWSDTGSGLAGNGGQIAPTDVSSSSSGLNLGSPMNYASKLGNLLKLTNLGNSGSGQSSMAQSSSPIAFTKPVIPRQPAFYATQPDQPIQNQKDLELTALIEALRNNNG